MRKLTTEADGRALAVRMLREGETLGVDETCLYPTGDERDGRPQNNYALRYLKRLRKTDTEEVFRGFAQILSDYCAAAQEASMPPEYYEHEEKDAASRSDPAFRQFINKLQPAA